MGGKEYHVYIMANTYRTVLYTGISGILDIRYFEHKLKKHPNSFTAKYNVTDLLHAETYSNPLDAIQREKQIKGWTRKKKLDLIKKENPTLRNLFEEE